MADGEQMASTMTQYGMQFGGQLLGAAVMSAIELARLLVDFLFKLISGIGKFIVKLFRGDEAAQNFNKRMDKVNPEYRKKRLLSPGLKSRGAFNRALKEKGTQAVEMDVNKYFNLKDGLNKDQLSRLLLTMHRDMPCAFTASRNAEGHQVIQIEQGYEADFRRAAEHFKLQKNGWGTNNRTFWRIGHASTASLATNIAHEVCLDKKQLKNDFDDMEKLSEEPTAVSDKPKQTQAQSQSQQAPSQADASHPSQQEAPAQSSSTPQRSSDNSQSNLDRDLSGTLKGRHADRLGTLAAGTVVAGEAELSQASQLVDSLSTPSQPAMGEQVLSPYEQAKQQAQQRVEQLSQGQASPTDGVKPEAPGKPSTGKPGTVSADDIKERLTDAQHQPSKPSAGKPVKVSAPKIGK